MKGGMQRDSMIWPQHGGLPLLYRLRGRAPSRGGLRAVSLRLPDSNSAPIWLKDKFLTRKNQQNQKKQEQNSRMSAVFYPILVYTRVCMHVRVSASPPLRPPHEFDI